MWKRFAPVLFGLGLCMLSLAGCQQGIPKDALQLSTESLEQRQLQTRRFDTDDEVLLLSAAAGLLQDLGFNLDESETRLGVLVASKDRDATEVGQVAAAIVVGAVLALLGGHPGNMAIDEKQKLRASVITRPIRNDNGDVTHTILRVTFQRIVWNTQGNISRIEGLKEPEMYQQFFDKLSKAVFLEAHSI